MRKYTKKTAPTPRSNVGVYIVEGMNKNYVRLSGKPWTVDWMLGFCECDAAEKKNVKMVENLFRNKWLVRVLKGKKGSLKSTYQIDTTRWAQPKTEKKHRSFNFAEDPVANRKKKYKKAPEAKDPVNENAALIVGSGIMAYVKDVEVQLKEKKLNVGRLIGALKKSKDGASYYMKEMARAEQDNKKLKNQNTYLKIAIEGKQKEIKKLNCKLLIKENPKDNKGCLMGEVARFKNGFLTGKETVIDLLHGKMEGGQPK